MKPRAMAAAVMMCTALVSGCGVTALDIPVPGGGISGDTYELNAVFTDALNLPDKAHVKIDGVDVGRVEDIRTENYEAHVRMVVLRTVRLPKGTTAQLRWATPLGDIFVALDPPEDGSGLLRDGDTLPVGDTSAAPGIEDTLAALSTLINGGGLSQLRTIVTEVNTALSGREGNARHLLHELDTTVSVLNQRSADIDRVLVALDKLSTTLDRRKDTINAALADMTPAVKVLADQTGQFTGLLAKLGDVGRLGAHVVQRTRADLTALLRDLQPVLDGFLALRDTLGPTLRDMVTLGKFIALRMQGDAGTATARITGPIVLGLPSPGGPTPPLPDLPEPGDLPGPLGDIAGGAADGLGLDGLGLTGLIGGDR